MSDRATGLIVVAGLVAAVLGPARAAAAAPLAGDGFAPVGPVRVLDSRPSGPAVGGYSTPWGPGVERDVAVAGVASIPADATAVVVNVTVTGGTAGSYLSVYPSGDSRPAASSLNFGPDQTVANAVTTAVGAGGTVSVYNDLGSVDVIIDVVGSYRAGTGDGYTPVAPARVLDSRPSGPAVGGYTTPWGPGVERAVTVAGVAGVPGDATAVVVNVTVTGGTAGSYLTVHPTGQPRPTASSLNWGPGQTVANAVTARVGAGGTVSVYNTLGSVDVIIDVVGSYRTGTGAGFHPLVPVRVLDSRPSGPPVGGYTTPLGAAITRAVKVAGVVCIPEDAAAVVLNATATGTTAGSYLTVYPSGEERPLGSSLNWGPGQTVANAVTAKVGAEGMVSLFNAAGSVDVVFDAFGYFR